MGGLPLVLLMEVICILKSVLLLGGEEADVSLVGCQVLQGLIRAT